MTLSSPRLHGIALTEVHAKTDQSGGPVQPLNGVSLAIRRRETLGVVNESGCRATLVSASEAIE
jgi:ABC-type dipeptide/oligopeptide/nickel transport system ATPase component